MKQKALFALLGLSILATLMMLPKVADAQYAASTCGSSTCAAELNAKLAAAQLSAAAASGNCTAGKDFWFNTLNLTIQPCPATNTWGTPLGLYQDVFTADSWFREDFPTGNSATTTIGSYGWTAVFASGGSLVRIGTTIANHPGILALSTGATNNATAALYMGNTSVGSDSLTRLDNLTGAWEFRFIIQSNTAVTSEQFRICLESNTNSRTACNLDTVRVEFDTAGAVSTTNFTYDFCNNSTCSTAIDSGIAVTSTDWFTLRIRHLAADAAGKVTFDIATNGGAFAGTKTFCASGCDGTGTMDTNPLSPGAYITDTGTADRRLYLDLFAGYVQGYTR